MIVREVSEGSRLMKRCYTSPCRFSPSVFEQGFLAKANNIVSARKIALYSGTFPMISKEEVFKIAHLARIQINETLAAKYSHDLSAILDHMEQLKKVDVTNVEPMTHAHGAKNIFREDVVEDSFSIKDTLKNAPDVNGQFFRVPLIKEHND